jgi:serine/threonine-protein kinase HipA
MTLAKAAGIRVAEARLVESDGLPVALIRRFDRTDCGRRLMYVSAATLARERIPMKRGIISTRKS